MPFKTVFQICRFEAAPPKPPKGRLGMMEEQMIVTVRIYRPFKKDLQQPNLTLNNTKFVQVRHFLLLFYRPFFKNQRGKTNTQNHNSQSIFHQNFRLRFFFQNVNTWISLLIQNFNRQEFHLLGTNYLSQLRDLIKCPTDLMTGGDMSGI